MSKSNKKQKERSNFSVLFKEVFLKKWYLGLLALVLAALLWFTAGAAV